MPTLPFAVFTKRLDVPTSRFELIRRFSLAWATILDVVMDPVTFTSADEVMPAAERVPVMSTGPPTTKLAVASMLETEMVPPDRRLLTVKLDVSMLDVVRVLSESMAMFADIVTVSVWKIFESVRMLPSVTNTLADIVSWSEWKMLETVIVPMLMGAATDIVSGDSMAIEVALMVRGEPPTMSDAVRVWHLRFPVIVTLSV